VESRHSGAYDGGKDSSGTQSRGIHALKVDYLGSRVTSDNGLLLVRELDERLGLSLEVILCLGGAFLNRTMMLRSVNTQGTA
jgi:hypothetical protein